VIGWRYGFAFSALYEQATRPRHPRRRLNKKATKQQLKMKDCAHEAKAKGFKGEARKQFMSKCLSRIQSCAEPCVPDGSSA
jgi:hypothetical protein